MSDVVLTIGVLVLRNKNKEVLLVKHGEKAGHPTGIYGLPSGRIEANETEKQASVRELKEETGLETSEYFLIELPYNFGVTELRRKKGTMLCSWKVFICKEYSGEMQTDGEETIPEWVKISELNEYWLSPGIKIAVSEGIKYLENETNEN